LASFNKITIVGYLGRDPEIRYTPSGDAVCTFSVATTERGSKGEDGRELTTWFRITTWRRQAEVANQYLSKGKQVYIEGRLRTNEFTDRDGNKRTSLEVTCTDMQFLSSGGSSDGEDSAPAPAPTRASNKRTSPPSNAQQPQDDDGGVGDDDIPF
jgi:single-strand DNA-binding protein